MSSAIGAGVEEFLLVSEVFPTGDGEKIGASPKVALRVGAYASKSIFLELGARAGPTSEAVRIVNSATEIHVLLFSRCPILFFKPPLTTMIVSNSHPSKP